MKKIYRYLIPAGIAFILASTITTTYSEETTVSPASMMSIAAEASSPQANSGQLFLPADYRKTWSHLGSWLAHDVGDAQGFHDVYTQPESVDYYKQTGEFKDGTILIKEVRAFEQGQMTTGKVSWAAGTKIVFMMIKDSQGKLNSPNWGEGWGWALFSADDLTKNISTDYKTDCLGCHIPAKSKDYVFTEGYPTFK